MIEFTDFDRDELRGVEWMRSLPRLEHAALAIAVNGGQHVFQARCVCRWEGPVRKWSGPRPTGAELRALNTRLWLLTVVDADEHMAQYAEKAS